MTLVPSPQFLLIDGDDTLWENNVYFEQAIEAFIDFLAHSSMSRDQVRAALDEIERMNVAVHGYGSASFTKNLRQTYERLAERDLQPHDIDRVVQLGERMRAAYGQSPPAPSTPGTNSARPME
jgi:putative hydrolase of the HAD superfamily